MKDDVAIWKLSAADSKPLESLTNVVGTTAAEHCKNKYCTSPAESSLPSDPVARKAALRASCDCHWRETNPYLVSFSSGNSYATEGNVLDQGYHLGQSFWQSAFSFRRVKFPAWSFESKKLTDLLIYDKLLLSSLVKWVLVFPSLR